MDAAGNLYIADAGNFRVRKVSTSGIITTVAGNGTNGYSGDGGPATTAQLSDLSGLAVDAAGNLYIADAGNFRVRKVSPSGTITTFAGSGNQGLYGDGGPATSAGISGLDAVAVDDAGNLYFTDYIWHIVRKVSANGIITRVAGNTLPGYAGDGGPATSAQLFVNLLSGLAVDSTGNIYVGDANNNAIRVLKPTNQLVLVSAVVDAATERAVPASPGKIVVIYGGGLGPSQLAQNQPSNGVFGTQLAGTTVSFNGTPAPLIYTSATQVAAIAPYEISGSSTAQVTVTSQTGVSSAFTVPIAASAPSLFSLNGTGAGQAAAVNVDGSINDAAHPVKIGGYVSLDATGEGQTSPAEVDGKLASTQPYPQPLLPVTITVGGLPATYTYAGAAPTEVAGLLQVVVQIPQGVHPGGYVPVVLKVGSATTVAGAAWIAVSGN